MVNPNEIPELFGSLVFNDRVMRVGLAGGTLSYRDQELTLYRLHLMHAFIFARTRSAKVA